MIYKMVCQSCNTAFDALRKNQKNCSSQCRQRMFRIRNPESVRSKRLADNAYTERRMLTRSRARAKRIGIYFDLDIEDITIPKTCPVLGIKLEHHNQGQGYHPNSVSLDRIKPELGYRKGNVRVISARANLLKNNATIQELECVLRDAQKIGL